MRPEGHLDLEGIAAGVDSVQVDGLEQVGSDRLEPPGKVAVRQPKNHSREHAAELADQPSCRRPLRDDAAGERLRAVRELADDGRDVRPLG